MFLDINRLQYFANHFSILTNSDLVTLEIDQMKTKPEFNLIYNIIDLCLQNNASNVIYTSSLILMISH